MKLALTVLFMMLALCLVTGESAMAWEDPNEGTGLDGGGGTGGDDDDHPWGGDGVGGGDTGGSDSTLSARNTSVAATVDTDPLDWLYEKYALITAFYFWKFDIQRFDYEPVSGFRQSGGGDQTSIDYRSRSNKGRVEK